MFVARWDHVAYVHLASHYVFASEVLMRAAIATRSCWHTVSVSLEGLSFLAKCFYVVAASHYALALSSRLEKVLGSFLGCVHR